MKRALFKSILLLALLAGSTLSTTAESVNALIVQMKNGTQATFLLTEKPNVSFAGTDLKIVTEKSESSFPLSDVQRFTYDKRDLSGIDETLKDPTDVNFQDGVLVVSQLRKGATVSLFATDGKLLEQFTARHTGTYRLNLSSLPKGVYLVKADNVTYKITKR